MCMYLSPCYNADLDLSGLGWCGSQLSCTITNTQDNQLIKGKGLFWFTFLEILVHDQLAPLLWTCGSISRKEHVAEEAHLHYGWKWKKKEEDWVPLSPVTGSPATRPLLLKAPPPPYNTMLGTKTLPLGLWGTIQIQTKEMGLRFCMPKEGPGDASAAGSVLPTLCCAVTASLSQALQYDQPFSS